MYNTRSRGRIVLAGSVRPHQGIRVGMLPTELSPSQALDVLQSEEAIPETEVSLSEGHVITSQLYDDNNVMAGSESIQPILSSPREGFQRDKIPTIAHNVQTDQGTISGLGSSPQNNRGVISGTGGGAEFLIPQLLEEFNTNFDDGPQTAAGTESHAPQDSLASCVVDAPEHALHLGDSKLVNAVTSEKVSAWENAPVEAWENVSAAAAAIAAASKSVNEIVSRPGEPCGITSTGTGTRFSAYAALDDDVLARVVSSKYPGGLEAQTQHRADWPVAPVLERIQTSTQQATPAIKGLGNWPVEPAPLRTSAAGDGATAKVTRQQGKHSTGSSSSTLQNVLMSDVDATSALTVAPTGSYLTPGQRSPSPTP